MKKSLFVTIAVLFMVLTGSVSGQKHHNNIQKIVCPDGVETTVCKAVYFDVSPPLSELAKIKVPSRKRKEDKFEALPNPRYEQYGRTAFPYSEDPVWQKQNGTYLPQTSGPIQNFDGTGNLDGYVPPDTQGDVGPDRYIQVVNSRYSVYDKTGTVIINGAQLGTIWAGIPAPWSSDLNAGDPVVVWDQAAQRWVISEFSLPSASQNAELIAISATSDPAGTWFRYVFQFGNQMPDYPKLAVWPDAYYLSFNQFTNQSTPNGCGAVALERAKMLVNDPSAQMVYKNLGSTADPFGMLPSDWDGSNTPPSGAPNYYMYFSDWAPNSATNPVLYIWSFSVNWTTPSSSTFVQTYTIPVAAFNSTVCSGGYCIPQPGTSVKLEALTDRLMYRNQYRNLNSYQAMVTSHTVNVGSGQAGMRWYELRNTGSGWTLNQQGTYAPDAANRWMGSVAMNVNGDIALGYSVSDGTSIYPSIRYTGRRASDAAGYMTVQEQTIIAGGGSQTTSYQRWGDYSMMSVDPTDDITFWYTQEYMQTTSSAGWHTRIASFKFSNNPAITTTDATSVTPTSATLNGTINPNGLASTYHFEWGTTTSYGNVSTTNSAGSGSAAVPVNAPITGLTAGLTYHFRLTGVNSDGSTNGNDMTFTPGGANVTTTAATGITMTAATSGGNVISDGGGSVSVRGVCWSTTANPTVSGNHTTDGAGLGTFTSSLTGLTANTLYHIRAYATNSYGTWYGNDLTFTTLCGIYTPPLNEPFNNTTIPGCWSQVDNQGSGEVWQFGTITGSGAPVLTGNYAFLNSDTYGSGHSQNADLVSPVLDCSAFTNVTLAFSHYFRSWSGSSATLSYSINGGTTWTQIQQWTASTNNPASFSQVIAACNGQSQVKFKWNYTGSYGYWWAVDNVAVTGTSANILSVAPANQNVPASPAGSTQFNVTSNTTWAASSNQSWCTITPSGTGNGTITANYTVYTGVPSRVATITVTGTGAPTQTVTVTQAGVAPTLTVAPANQAVPATPAGSTNFTVTSNTDWTVLSDQTWCTVTPSGTGNGTIAAAYAVNPNTSARVANITVTVTGLSPIVVTVTQAAAAPNLSVTPANQAVPYSPAGTTAFAVLSNSTWTTSSNASWCTVTPSGTGNGNIIANYAVNTDLVPRVATITVTVTGLSPVTVTVTQDPAPPTLTVQPSNQNVPASPASTTAFSVTSNTGWTVVSDQAWCTVTPSGTGNGTIIASYEVNTSTSSRIANVTVTVTGLSPLTVTVTQSGLTPTLSVSPSNQNVGYPAGNTSFSVFSNSAWTATSDSAWLTVTPSGYLDGTITATFLQNPYHSQRVATVTVTVAGLPAQNVTVTQAQSTVSVPELNAGSVRIIPNPAKGTFRVDMGDIKYSSVNISILDMNGRTIMYKVCWEKPDLRFDLSNSPEGSYFVRIVLGDSEVTQKLILTH